MGSDSPVRYILSPLNLGPKPLDRPSLQIDRRWTSSCFFAVPPPPTPPSPPRLRPDHRLERLGRGLSQFYAGRSCSALNRASMRGILHSTYIYICIYTYFMCAYMYVLCTHRFLAPNPKTLNPHNYTYTHVCPKPKLACTQVKR